MPIQKADGKKDGLQKYRVRVNYVDDLGNYKQAERTAYGYDNAKTIEQELTKKLKETKQSKQLTVNELFDEYVKVKQFEIRESSLDKNKTILVNHVLPTFGNMKLDKINITNLKNWKLEIENKQSKYNKPLSFTMKKNIYTSFRALLNFAVDYNYLSVNPLNKVGNFKNAYQTKDKIQYYTVDEFKKYISAALDNAQSSKDDIFEWNFYVFFNIAFYTGMRKGEINALTWNDISDNIIHITKSITQKFHGEDRETPPKNLSSIRDIQIPVPLQNILKQHYDRYKEIADFSENWHICGGPQCVRDSTLDKRNILFAEKAGIKKIRIHDFRHSHASLLANEGINIQEIARRLGHAKIEITWNTYSHLYPREEERALNILNKIY